MALKTHVQYNECLFYSFNKIRGLTYDGLRESHPLILRVSKCLLTVVNSFLLYYLNLLVINS